MNDIKKKISYLLDKQDWDEDDRQWMREYLEQGDISLLQSIAKEKYDEDISRLGRILDEKLSKKILSKIHNHIDRKSWKSRVYKVILPAAAAAVLLLLSFGLYQFFNTKKADNYVEVYTTAGQSKKLVLEDGTQVWLSPESHFSYPKKFDGSQRKVSLDGEAFFHVSKDPSHPFIISSGALKTKVVGTSFNINAYKGRKYAMVTVAAGIVDVTNTDKVHADKASHVVLSPNQRAVLTLDDEVLTKEDFPDAAKILLERRNGHLEYHGADVLAVVEDLSVQYGIRIKLDKDFNKCTYYGDFEIHHDSLDVSLKLLCLTLNATLKKNGADYVIDGKGC